MGNIGFVFFFTVSLSMTVFYDPKLQFKGVLSVKKMHSKFGLQAHRKLISKICFASVKVGFRVR